jgi:hypothetical protein
MEILIFMKDLYYHGYSAFWGFHSTSWVSVSHQLPCLKLGMNIMMLEYIENQIKIHIKFLKS